MEDGITYYDLDKSKIESMAYEENKNSSINMDIAVVVKVKKGYANTAKKKLQKSLTQTVDYNKLYNMDTIRVNQARIFVKGNYVGMFILGKKADDKLSVQKQAKIAKSEAAKIDKAWKAVFGGKVKNLAKIKWQQWEKINVFFKHNIFDVFFADNIRHISMGSWFRDYVYIPLGGSRKGKGTVRQIINIGIVWLLTGLWHGASVNFILWGIYFGVILMAEKAFILKWLVKIPKVFRRCYSYLIVTISWILFACTKRLERIVFFKALTGIGKKFVCDRESMYLMFSYLPLIAICFVAAAPFGKNIYSIIQKRSETRLTNASVACFWCSF